MKKYPHPALEKHFESYYIPEAALLWRGVPKKKVWDILRNSDIHPLVIDSPPLDEVWKSFEYKWLEGVARKIARALANKKLELVTDLSPTPPEISGRPWPGAQKISRDSFKAWIEKEYPDTKKPSLFSAVERSKKPLVSGDAHATLKAKYANLQKEKEAFKYKAETYKALKAKFARAREENKAIKSEHDSLAKEIKNKEVLKEDERSSYLKVIGVLLEIVLGKFTEEQECIPYKTQDSLIYAIQNKYGECKGLSESTLEKKFAASKKSLKPCKS